MTVSRLLEPLVATDPSQLSEFEFIIWTIFYIFLGTLALSAIIGCLLALSKCCKTRNALRKVHELNPGIR